MSAATENIGSEWHAGVPRTLRAPALIAIACLVLGLLAFGAWAGIAPISGAIVAQGSFAASGENKIVQHLEGGIINAILVKEGDVVKPGQTLMRLDDTAARAQLRRLELNRYRQLAMQARLDAERRSKDEITFPKSLTAALDDPEVREISEGQEYEFQARQAAVASEIDVLNQRIAAIEQEISGVNFQHVAAVSQLTFIERELTGKQTLYDKGLTDLPTLLALKRAEAKLTGEGGQATAEIGRAKERIAETRSQIIHLKHARIEKAAEDLRDVESELDDVQERIKAASDVLTRTEIKAPVRGIVVKLAHHTSGGVISAGQEILELLPVDEELLVEAYIRPVDIDAIHNGNTAQLRLTALNQRITPMIPGRVVYISADTIEGKRPDEIFYVSRIKIDKQAAKKLASFKPTPGMPVEVYIDTGKRTFFEYLAKPVSDSVSRAFREG